MRDLALYRILLDLSNKVYRHSYHSTQMLNAKKGNEKHSDRIAFTLILSKMCMCVLRGNSSLSEPTIMVLNDSFIKHLMRCVGLVPSGLNAQLVRLDDALGIHFLRQFWITFVPIMIPIFTGKPCESAKSGLNLNSQS